MSPPNSSNPQKSSLLLAGDHLYRMNYQDFVTTHRKTGADITVAALPTDEKQATVFGLMKIDGTGRIQVTHISYSLLLLHALCAFLLPTLSLGCGAAIAGIAA